jgi:hypothetical protein
MACAACNKFPFPGSNFTKLDESIERHGELYKCNKCGSLFELIAEERSIFFTPLEELKKYYKVLNKEINCDLP